MDGRAHSKVAEARGTGRMRKHNGNTSVKAKAHVMVGFYAQLLYHQGLFQAGTGSFCPCPESARHESALNQNLRHCS